MTVFGPVLKAIAQHFADPASFAERFRARTGRLPVRPPARSHAPTTLRFPEPVDLSDVRRDPGHFAARVVLAMLSVIAGVWMLAFSWNVLRSSPINQQILPVTGFGLVLYGLYYILSCIPRERGRRAQFDLLILRCILNCAAFGMTVAFGSHGFSAAAPIASINLALDVMSYRNSLT